MSVPDRMSYILMGDEAFTFNRTWDSSEADKMADHPAPRKHFLIVTFPHFGHVIPTLELAKHISVYHDVTFVASAVTVQEIIKRELSPLLAEDEKFRLIGIDDGVPLHPEPTVQQVLDEIDMMEKSPLTSLLRNMPIKNQSTLTTGNTFGISKPVDMVILERFISTVLPICMERGVPCSLFITSATIDKLEYLDNEEEVTGHDLMYLILNKPLKQASAVLFNSFQEAAEGTIKVLASNAATASIPAFCVGPLLPKENSRKELPNKNALIEQKVLNWMDQQEPNSVVYISFGSLARPNAEQIHELTNALTGFGRPFIFSLQERDQQHLSEALRLSIPTQLGVKKSPQLILFWCPQKSILGHSNCGVFISHCGWNSTLEAAAAAVPVVAWPMFSDQYGNGQWLVDKGGAVLVPNTALPEYGGRVVPSVEILDVLEEVQKASYRSGMERLKSSLQSATTDGGTAQQELQQFLNSAFHPR